MSQENTEAEKDMHMSMLIAGDHNKEKDNMVIMDSGGTTNLFGAGGRHLLWNFRWVEKGVKIECNWKADYEFFKVWYYDNAICNVMSLDVMNQKYWVTFDSNDMGGVFKVHTPRGLVEFQKAQNGFCCIDVVMVKKMSTML